MRPGLPAIAQVDVCRYFDPTAYRIVLFEKILEADKGQHLAYAVIGGMPVRTTERT